MPTSDKSKERYGDENKGETSQELWAGCADIILQDINHEKVPNAPSLRRSSVRMYICSIRDVNTCIVRSE